MRGRLELRVLPVIRLISGRSPKCRLATSASIGLVSAWPVRPQKSNQEARDAKRTLTVIALAALAGLACAAVSSASGGIKGAAAGGKLTVRISGMNEGGKGDRVTNGGLAGTGRFTTSGAISEKGKVVVYRTVKAL